jgi:hypothetical protein
MESMTPEFPFDLFRDLQPSRTARRDTITISRGTFWTDPRFYLWPVQTRTSLLGDGQSSAAFFTTSVSPWYRVDDIDVLFSEQHVVVIDLIGGNHLRGELFIYIVEVRNPFSSRG